MEAAAAPYFHRPVIVKTRNPAAARHENGGLRTRLWIAIEGGCRPMLSSYSDGGLRKNTLENRRGGVAERLNAPVLKTGMPATASRVRIPPPPPIITVPHHPARSN